MTENLFLHYILQVEQDFGLKNALSQATRDLRFGASW